MITHPQVLDSTLHEGNNSLLVNCSNALAERLADSRSRGPEFQAIEKKLYSYTACPIRLYLVKIGPHLGILQA